MNARMELGLLLAELWDGVTETRSEEIAERANELSPDPDWSDYLFHSEEFVGEEDRLLLEKLLDKIFSYRPIA
jgi:hypothetical protein